MAVVLSHPPPFMRASHMVTGDPDEANAIVGRSFVSSCRRRRIRRGFRQLLSRFKFGPPLIGCLPHRFVQQSTRRAPCYGPVGVASVEYNAVFILLLLMIFFGCFFFSLLFDVCVNTAGTVCV